MENNELLDKFVNSVINKTDDGDDMFKTYLKNKASNYVAEIRAKQAFSDKLNEAFNDDAIQFNGEDVVINGKVVGKVKTDLNDMESGIDFISADGRMSKEFHDFESLYSYLATTFGVRENSITGNLGTKLITPKPLNIGKEVEPKMPPHDDKADLKDKNKDSFNPDGETDQGELSRTKKIRSLAASIKNGARPTSTKVSESEEDQLDENGEWTMKNKDVDGQKTGKLKTQIKKMRNKADKSGNK